MKTRSYASAALIITLCLTAAANGSAQTRDQLQLLADIRALQEQVQLLRVTIAQLAEGNRALITALDSQADARRALATNQLFAIREIQTPVNALGEQLNQNKLEVAKLSAELDSIRQGNLAIQQNLANVLTRLRAVSAGATEARTLTDPAAPASATALPSAEAWNHAMDAYQRADFAAAAAAFQDIVLKFPATPAGADAQFQAAESLRQANRCTDAVAGYASLISTYPDSPRVPQAYLYQAECYEKLLRKPEAIAAYKLVYDKYRTAIEGAIAKQRLIHLNVLK